VCLQSWSCPSPRSVADHLAPLSPVRGPTCQSRSIYRYPWLTSSFPHGNSIIRAILGMDPAISDNGREVELAPPCQHQDLWTPSKGKLTPFRGPIAFARPEHR